MNMQIRLIQVEINSQENERDTETSIYSSRAYDCRDKYKRKKIMMREYIDYINIFKLLEV